MFLPLIHHYLEAIIRDQNIKSVQLKMNMHMGGDFLSVSFRFSNEPSTSHDALIIDRVISDDRPSSSIY